MDEEEGRRANKEDRQRRNWRLEEQIATAVKTQHIYAQVKRLLPYITGHHCAATNDHSVPGPESKDSPSLHCLPRARSICNWHAPQPTSLAGSR